MTYIEAMAHSREVRASEFSARRVKNFQTLWRPRADCFVWVGSCVAGRPSFGRMHAARVAYALAYGVCPSELSVRQTCGDKFCINPAHLYLSSAPTGRPMVRTFDEVPIVYEIKMLLERGWTVGQLDAVLSWDRSDIEKIVDSLEKM